MGICFGGLFSRFYIGILGISIGAMILGCAPPSARDARAAGHPRAEVDTGMLNSVQVEEGKRASHERGIVGLQRFNSRGEKLGVCGAVLIRPDVVLTAGHCVDPRVAGEKVISLRALAVVDTNGAGEAESTTRNVIKVVSHPLYRSCDKLTENGSVYDHDMAIVFLDRRYDSSVPPQPISESNDVFTVGQELALYGYGRGIDYAGGRADPAAKFLGTLQRGSAVLSGERYYDRILSRANSKNFLCDGDSGGPAFSISKNGKIAPVVVAVNSAQMGKPMMPGSTALFCKNAPSVFQPIAPFRGWIDQVLKENGR